MSRARFALAFSFSFLWLAGCGGGGGGSDDPDEPANARPVADATASPLTGNAPLEVAFSASASSDSDGEIASYAWDFGDGSTGSGEQPAHVYADAGSYAAELTVTDNDGASDTDTVTITVTAAAQNEAPAAAFTATPDRGTVALTVTFNAAASTDADGSIASYAWSFGDDTTGSGVSTTHTYNAPGSYPAILTVTDNDGATDSDATLITVTVPANQSPTASFTMTPASGVAPLAVTLDASASSDADGSITSYLWSMSDGGSTTGATAAHTFTASGSYSITLFVVDNAGASASVTRTITVASADNLAPSALIAASTVSGAAPLAVDFDASGSSDSDGSIAQYAWDFGDGASSMGTAVSHTYTSTGNYFATLTVTDDGGRTASTNVQISVSAGGSFTVSGTLTATTSTIADSDVNDPLAEYASNDFLGEEQVLPNPAVVGGFASAVGTGGGVSGTDRYADAGDVDDLFLVQLAAGQSLVLAIADWNASDEFATDLDLLLYDATTLEVMDFSAGTGMLETISVDEALLGQSTNGEFIVQVNAYAGISNYTLTISDAAAPAVEAARSLNHGGGFIAGEAIVMLRDATAAKSQVTATQKAAASGLSHKAGRADRAMLFTAGGDYAAALAGTPHAMRSSSRSPYGATSEASRRMLDSIAIVKGLRARDDIASAGLNYMHRPLSTPNDPLYAEQWHYRLINLPQAWDITTGTSDVIVAIADTGVFLAHPDLAGNLVPGFDFISNTGTSKDGDGIDANPDDPGDDATPGNSSWHGTHVAGTVGAVTDNGVGGAGVAGDARLMPLRVLGVGGGSSYDIIQSIYYAAGLPNDSGQLPAEPADIINLSLGCLGCYNAASEDAYQAARAAGVIVVAAAGNESTSTTSYPAGYEGVISVSAVRPDAQQAYYSNFGATVDVAAPGGDQSLGYYEGVLSTLVDDTSGTRRDTYEFYQGTSMAAPHMAGVVALMKSVYPALTPDDVDALLASGAITRDIGTAGRDDLYGHGLIDARMAVEAALALDGGAAPTPGTLTVNPSLLAMGTDGTTANITVAATGDGALAVTSATSNASWLAVNALTVDGNALGTYTLSVDRSGLTPTTYQGRVTFTADNGSSVFVQVSMTVSGAGSPAGAGDVGVTYVLLIDPVSFETIEGLAVLPAGGAYAYSFEAVPGGSYMIVAGTDMDNDFIICDAGEACGAYPTLGQSAQVVIDADRDDIDFLLNFDVEIIGSSALRDDTAGGFRRGETRKRQR